MTPVRLSAPRATLVNRTWVDVNRSQPMGEKRKRVAGGQKKKQRV